MAHKYTENKDQIHLMMHETNIDDYMVSNTMKLMTVKPEKLIPVDVESNCLLVFTSYYFILLNLLGLPTSIG